MQKKQIKVCQAPFLASAFYIIHSDGKLLLYKRQFSSAARARWQNIIWQKGKLARECRKDVVLLVPGDIARDGVVNSELTSAASGAARAPESERALCLRCYASEREREAGEHLDAARETPRAPFSAYN